MCFTLRQYVLSATTTLLNQSGLNSHPKKIQFHCTTCHSPCSQAQEQRNGRSIADAAMLKKAFDMSKTEAASVGCARVITSSMLLVANGMLAVNAFKHVASIVNRCVIEPSPFVFGTVKHGDTMRGLVVGNTTEPSCIKR